MSHKRITSWAPDEQTRDDRITHAERLVGESIAAVRYFDLAYSDHGAAEPPAPSWQFGECHSIDHGIEIDTQSGRLFSITWDPPGRIEGIGLREEPLVGRTLLPQAEVAIWNVGDCDEWRSHIGNVVSGVKMHYRPWDDSGAWWCSRITIADGVGPIEIFLAECMPNAPGPVKSSDNVVVLFDQTDLPEWA